MNRVFLFSLRLLYVFALPAGTAYAQNAKIDSLQKQLNKTTDPITRVYILDELGWEYLYIDPDKTIEYVQQSFAIHTDPKYFDQNSQVSQVNRAAGYSYLGNAYNIKGDYESSLRYHYKALALADSLKDDKRRSTMMISIGNTLNAMRSYDESIRYYYMALELKIKLGDKKGEIRCLQNIGGVYLYTFQNDSAAYYMEKARDLAIQNGSDKSLIIPIETNLGVVYKRQGKWKKAIDSYKWTVALRREGGEKYRLIQSLMNLGILYTEIDSIPQAMAALQEAYALVRNSNFDDIHMEVLRSLAKAEYLSGNSDSVYWHLIESNILSEKVFKASLSKNATEMQSKYDLDKKQREIMLLSREQKIQQIEAIRQQQQISLLNSERARKEIELAANQEKIKAKQNQLELLNKQKVLESNEAKAREAQLTAEAEKAEGENRRQRIIIFSVIIGLILSLVSVFFIFRSLQQTRKQRRIIEQQKIQAEEQKELLQEKNKEILDSITYARRLQEAILPPAEYISSLLPENFVIYFPKDIVAGDFYFLEQEKNKIIIAVADCTGHGVPGAMVSVVCSNALNRVVKEFGETDPGKILDRTRALVMDTFRRSDQEVKDGMDISLCTIERKENEFTLQWAGANNPLWYLENDTMNEIAADKQPIGFSYEAHPFVTHTLSLKKGDAVFLFSDGYADQFGGPRGKKFKYRTLQEFISQRKSLSMPQLKDELVAAYREWKGEIEQIDDVSMIGIRLV
ncbi:MAG TPA: tetratricopeptide repeat protein [Flavobacteriales bacterium]|nr:tetratricopeptide repeat protein [Flavobacteriales bacterium]HRJ34859.1 tetratricopeptide repeat protein [Flavobacteriales bacterium]